MVNYVVKYEILLPVASNAFNSSQNHKYLHNSQVDLGFTIYPPNQEKFHFSYSAHILFFKNSSTIGLLPVRRMRSVKQRNGPSTQTPSLVLN